MPRVTVEAWVNPEEALDELSDEELENLLRSRGYRIAKNGRKIDVDKQAMLQDAISGLPVVDQLRDALAATSGMHLVEAFESAVRGDRSMTIIHLDRAYDPTPAETIGSLPIN